MKKEAHSLQSYLGLLGPKKIATIDSPVSTKFEVAALERALDGRRALLIKKPAGSKFPITANLLTSHAKFAEALSTDVASFERFFLSAAASPSKPSHVDEGSFHFAEGKAHLRDLPIVHHFANDTGPYVTSSIVIAKNIETGTQNVSVYRLLRLADGFQLAELKKFSGRKAVLDGRTGELLLD